MEPLPHVDQLVRVTVDQPETRGARFFTKLDLAMAYMQFRIRVREPEKDQHKTSRSFCVPGGQYEFPAEWAASDCTACTRP